MLPPPMRVIFHMDTIDGCTTGLDIYTVLSQELTMEARLEAVLGVWVEMLCYATSYCNRKSHARELSNGFGEC